MQTIYTRRRAFVWSFPAPRVSPLRPPRTWPPLSIAWLSLCGPLEAMNSQPLPSSKDLSRYLEARGELGKPWMWHLLRLAKLRELKDTMAPEEYMSQLQEAHADLMRLGEFWQGREREVFGGAYTPASVLEPLPGSPDDR